MQSESTQLSEEKSLHRAVELERRRRWRGQVLSEIHQGVRDRVKALEPELARLRLLDLEEKSLLQSDLELPEISMR